MMQNSSKFRGVMGCGTGFMQNAESDPNPRSAKKKIIQNKKKAKKKKKKKKDLPGRLGKLKVKSRCACYSFMPKCMKFANTPVHNTQPSFFFQSGQMIKQIR